MKHVSTLANTGTDTNPLGYISSRQSEVGVQLQHRNENETRLEKEKKRDAENPLVAVVATSETVELEGWVKKEDGRNQLEYVVVCR